MLTSEGKNDTRDFKGKKPEKKVKISVLKVFPETEHWIVLERLLEMHNWLQTSGVRKRTDELRCIKLVWSFKNK